jgi:hypothetical protein
MITQKCQKCRGLGGYYASDYPPEDIYEYYDPSLWCTCWDCEGRGSVVWEEY